MIKAIPTILILSTGPLVAQEDIDKDNVEKIDVTGSRIQKTEADDVSKIEISGEEAQLVAPSGDVAQVPKLFPGTLSRPNDSEVAIRGSEANDALYYIDNLQAPNLFEPISGTSVVPSRAISTLSFFPGNFDSQYGDSTAGVIKLGTRDADIIDPYTEIRLNTPIYTSAYHEQGLGGNASMILSLRKSILEPFVALAPLDDGQFLLPYFQDAYLQHYYDNNDNLSVKTRYVHSRSGAEVKVISDRSTETDGTSEFNFKTGYDLFGLDIETNIGAINIELDPYISKSLTEFSVRDIFFKIEPTTLTVPLRVQVELDQDVNLYLGLQPSVVDFKLEALVPASTNQGAFNDSENSQKFALNVNSTVTTQAAWATLEWGIGDLLITPNFRIYQQSFIDEVGVDPRLATRWKISDSQTLKLGIGQFTTAPLPQELDESYGNPNLSWIHSTHYTAGIESLFGGLWSNDLQVFYKRWRNDIFDSPTERFTHETTRYSQGLEWFLRYGEGTDLFGWLSYTMSETKEKQGPGAKEVFSDTDSTHILHLVGNYKLSSSLQIGARFKHQTGYVFTPVDVVWYSPNTDTYQPELNSNLINSERVPDTTTLSIFAQKNFPYKSWTLVTRFGFEEYQFTKSSPNFSYNYDYSERQFTTGLPVIPFIELRAIL